MRTRHTPGPWESKPKHNGDRQFFYVRAQGERIGQSTRAVCDTLTATPMDRANARLIAAAPDLLEALIDALIVARESGVDGDYWYRLAVKALSKAGFDEFGNEKE